MPNHVFAISSTVECKTLPSCADMGYIFTKDECTDANKPYLRCPFDETKYYCKRIAEKDCKIGDIFMADPDEDILGCTQNNEGNNIFIGVDSDSRCRYYPMKVIAGSNTSYQGVFDRVAAANWKNAATASANQNNTMSLFEILTLCQNDAIAYASNSSRTTVGGLCMTTSDYPVCVNMDKCVVEYHLNYDTTGWGDNNTYILRMRKVDVRTTPVDKCHPDPSVSVVPTARDLAKVSCIPGAYRTQYSGSGLPPYCLGNDTFSPHLILSVYDFPGVWYIDLSSSDAAGTVVPTMITSAPSKLPSGYSLLTFEELKLLHKELHKRGEIAQFLQAKGLTNYWFVSSEGGGMDFSCINLSHSVTTPPTKRTLAECQQVTAGFPLSFVGKKRGSASTKDYAW